MCLNLEKTECYEYKELDAFDRGISYGQGHNYCDKMNPKHSSSIRSPGWEGEGWYRFSKNVKIPERDPVQNHCGTSCSGWISGIHPISEGETVSVKACFCGCLYSTTIKVTKCSDYYVYFLKEVPTCSLRYCTV